MEIYLKILSTVLPSLVLILHIIGQYLLWKTNQRKKEIFIVSVSLSNIVFCVYVILCFPLDYFIPGICMHSTIAISGAIIPFHGSLILLTLERFLEVYYHMKYKLSWFFRNRVTLCLIIWVAWPMLFLIIMVAFYKYQIPYEKIRYFLFTYFDTAGQLMVTFHFLFVYIYLYYKTRDISRDRMHSKLFLPFLLVLTFTVFETIPALIFVVRGHFHILVWLLYCMDMLCNVLFYIFLQPNVRKLLYKKICVRIGHQRTHQHIVAISFIRRQNHKNSLIENQK